MAQRTIRHYTTTIRLPGTGTIRYSFTSAAPTGADVQKYVSGRHVILTLTDTPLNHGRFHAEHHDYL
ncbi:hypothetical protein [Streptomyces sp. NBC_01361]|uniref:hypothetical protein n=1 Tax=Streptomyces sp. NBC_01361 TaxID=2903838 RepID=UPI002E31692F|nr:hypothetical protein [Streptomyces sp. NBC_01361]